MKNAFIRAILMPDWRTADPVAGRIPAPAAAHVLRALALSAVVHLAALAGSVALMPRVPVVVEVSLVAPPREILLPAAVSGGAGNRSPHAATARPAPRTATGPDRAQGRVQGGAFPPSGSPERPVMQPPQTAVPPGPAPPAAAPIRSSVPPPSRSAPSGAMPVPSPPSAVSATSVPGAIAPSASPSGSGGVPGSIGLPGGAARFSGPASAASASGVGNAGAGSASSGGPSGIASGVSSGVGPGSAIGDGTGHVPSAPRALRDRIQSRVAYPAESIRREEEGEVLLRVLVGREGDPREIRVVRSSGLRRLDDAARRGVSGAAPLPSSPGWYEVPVRFSLR